MSDNLRKSKELIAKAAEAEFAEHGYNGARTDQIARIAGVNKQLIYYYYGSKAKLFEAVSRLAAQDLSLHGSRVVSGASPTEALRTQLAFLFDTARERPDLTSVLLGEAPGNARETVEEWGRETVNAIAATISQGQGLGFFKDDVDPRLAARQAVTLLLGYFALGPIVDQDGESSDAWTDAATTLLLEALLW